MVTCRSAILQAHQQHGSKNAVSESSGCKKFDVFSLCLQPDDGCFVISCDRCDEWCHGDCMGITPAVGWQIEEDSEEFVCLVCVSSHAVVNNCFSSPTIFYPSTLCLDFQWGDKDGETLCQLMKDAYETVVHWRQNCFLIPLGKAGKVELARLYHAYADNSTLHSITFIACCVLQVLLFQKLHAKSKSKEHVASLEHRLVLWHNGDIPALLKEGKCIQDHPQSTIQSGFKARNVTRTFNCLMSLGKVSELIAEDFKCGVLSLDSQISCNGGTIPKSVRDILAKKHSILLVRWLTLILFWIQVVLFLLVMILFYLNSSLEI